MNINKKVYYFYSRGGNPNFYGIKIEAWVGESTFYAYQNMHGESFNLLETLKIHACKKHSENEPKRFHSLRLDHEKGLNLTMSSSAKTEKEFLEKKLKDMQQITQRDFFRLKNFILNYHKNYTEIDYDNLGESEKNTTYTNN